MNTYPVIYIGINYNKPWNKDPVIHQPGFNGKYPAVFFSWLKWCLVSTVTPLPDPIESTSTATSSVKMPRFLCWGRHFLTMPPTLHRSIIGFFLGWEGAKPTSAMKVSLVRFSDLQIWDLKIVNFVDFSRNHDGFGGAQKNLRHTKNVS